MFCALSGYSKEELIGNNPRILHSGRTPKETYDDLWETVLQGKVWNGEFLNKKKNGKLYWESAVISPIYNDDGNITHFVGIKEEISPHIETEGKSKQSKSSISLRTSKSFYHTLVEDLPVKICRYAADGTITFINNNYCNFVQKTAEELVGIVVNELLTNIMKYAFTDRTAGSIEIIVKENQGKVSLLIQDNGKGLPEGFDITESKGFGLMLIKILSEQLDGKFTIQNNNGTRSILEFSI